MFPDLTRDDVFRLETRRLWLRWPRVADAQAIVRLAGEKAVAEMTARIPHPVPAGRRRAFDPADAAGECGRARPAAGHHAEGQAPMPDRHGRRSGREPEDGGPTLGYWLGMPSWGKGYATEAARALIDAFFAYTEERELVAVGAGHQSGLAARAGEVRLRLSGLAARSSSRRAAACSRSITSASTGAPGRA